MRENPGQCVITAGQILWTAECERALVDADKAKHALHQLKKKWGALLTLLTGVTRSKLNKIERNKVRSTGLGGVPGWTGRGAEASGGLLSVGA